MEAGQDVGEVDFSGLILGFSSAALSYLGFGVDGRRGGPKSLALAKQNIDIIRLLRDKSDGNLSPEEERLIQDILKDLMFKFAECSK